MFGLSFRFLAGRYHATPWGRNVNEADVAWPPEPWRILRALVACYWRKGDRGRWSEDDLARLIDILAADLPVFHLPEGGIHAHTRHYMPVRKGKSESKTLVFDAFLHLPTSAEVVAIWRDTTLDSDLLDLSRDLASGIGYLGRAESWTECRVVTEVAREPNCGPAGLGFTGRSLRVLAPRSPASYDAERKRLVVQEKERLIERSKKALTERALQGKLDRSLTATGGVHTLPPRLLDALSVDTSDLQNRRWDRPPAAYEAIYARSPEAAPSVIARASHPRGGTRKNLSDEPTVARYLLAGRPLPRMEDAVKIGEVMRAAAMSKFGWATDDQSGKRLPRAPWQISGRDEGNKTVSDPAHPHAFWLPEDADEDGWIDHLVVYIASGMNAAIRSRLDRLTRIWLTPRGGRAQPGETPQARRVATRVGRVRKPRRFYREFAIARAVATLEERYAFLGFRPLEEGRIPAGGAQTTDPAGHRDGRCGNHRARGNLGGRHAEKGSELPPVPVSRTGAAVRWLRGALGDRVSEGTPRTLGAGLRVPFRAWDVWRAVGRHYPVGGIDLGGIAPIRPLQ